MMNTKFTANKIFTDRESYKKSLNDSLDRLLNKGEKEFLYFYGVGGQGKTSICKEFINKILPQKDSVEYVLTDFQASEHREMPEILENVREGLGKKLKAKFTAFDITFLRYKTIISNSDYVRSRYSYMFKFENNIMNNVKIIADEIFSGVPVPGLETLYKVTKHFGKKYYEHKLAASEKFLKDIKIDFLTPIEIKRILPLAFAHDLNRIMKNNNKKVIIIFDTYEQLWTDKSKRKSLSASQVDNWVNQLFDNINNDTLIVGFGRDMLLWPQGDEKYDSNINQHRLGKLSNEDCDSYLKNIPIAEKNIREKIIKTSEGLPYYLDLQVNTYEQLKNDNKTISVEQFGNNPEEIHTRFVNHIGYEEEKRLTYVAIPRIVNEQIIELLVDNNFFQKTPGLFESIISESYFEELNNTKEYSLHNLLRDHLITKIKETDEDEYIDLNEILAEFYQTIVDDLINNSNFGEKLEVASKELLHHLSICNIEKAFNYIKIIFESDIVNKSRNLNLALNLCELFTGCVESIESNKESIINYYMLMIEWKLRNHSRVIEIYDNSFNDIIANWDKNTTLMKENPDINYGQVGLAYCSALHDKGYYKKLNDFIISHNDLNYGLQLSDLNHRIGKNGLAFAQVFNQWLSYNETAPDSDSLKDLRNGIYYNRIGNYYANLNLHNCAIEAYKNSYQRISDNDAPQSRAIALYLLGITKLNLGDIAGFSDLKEALGILEENNLKNHVFYYMVKLDILISELKQKTGPIESSRGIRDSLVNYLEIISKNYERVIDMYIFDIIENIETNKFSAIINYLQYLTTMYGHYTYQLIPFLRKAKEHSIDLGFDISKRIKDIISLTEYNVRTDGLKKVDVKSEKYQLIFDTVSSTVLGVKSNDCKEVTFFELPFWNDNFYLSRISFEDFTLTL